MVAVWDQRGTGKSHAALDPAPTWTLGQRVADTVAALPLPARPVRRATRSTSSATRGAPRWACWPPSAPELFHAYIGAGQMVSQLDQPTGSSTAGADYAERTGDTALVERLRGLGTAAGPRDIYAYAFLIDY